MIDLERVQSRRAEFEPKADVPARVRPYLHPRLPHLTPNFLYLRSTSLGSVWLV